MREPDALDRLLVAAVTVLAYLHLPWRPEIRAALRRAAARASALLDGELLLASLVVSVVLFIVFVSKVLPRLGRVE